jgi:hypothetical protein
LVYLAFLRKGKVSQNGDVKLFTVAHHEGKSAGLKDASGGMCLRSVLSAIDPPVNARVARMIRDDISSVFRVPQPARNSVPRPPRRPLARKVVLIDATTFQKAAHDGGREACSEDVEPLFEITDLLTVSS